MKCVLGAIEALTKHSKEDERVEGLKGDRSMLVDEKKRLKACCEDLTHAVQCFLGLAEEARDLYLPFAKTKFMVSKTPNNSFKWKNAGMEGFIC